MPPPQNVTVTLSAEESRSLHEAAEVLSVPPEKLLGAAAVAFARLCGFRKTATASVRRSPSWGPPPASEIPEAILEVPLDPDTADQVEAAAGYVRWEGPEGMLSVTLPEYIVGAAMRLIQETRVDGSPPSYRGLADQLFALSRPRAESAFRSSLGGPAVAPPFEPPSFEPPSRVEPRVRAEPVRAEPPPASRPAYAHPRPGAEALAPPPGRPSYTLPRKDRPVADAPSARPSYTLPRKGRRSPESPPEGPEPGRRGSAGSAPGKPARGAPAGALRGKPVDPAAPPSGPIPWLRQRPLLLAGVGAGVLLLVLLGVAYTAATAPAESRRSSSAPLAAVAPAPAARSLEPQRAAGDPLRLDAAPAAGETAAVALKHWEDAAPAAPEVPSTPYVRSRNHGKNIDALLAERYGRPKVLADASLKPEAYDADIAAAVADVVRIYPVPPALVKAVIRRESNFNPNAISQVGAIGMMQLMPYTAKKVGLTISDLWVPRKNILGGTRLLSALLQYYDGDVISALAAYNARPREPLAPLPKNSETPEYVAAVLRFYEEYNGSPLQRPPANPLDAPLRPGR